MGDFDGQTYHAMFDHLQVSAAPGTPVGRTWSWLCPQCRGIQAGIVHSWRLYGNPQRHEVLNQVSNIDYIFRINHFFRDNDQDNWGSNCATVHGYGAGWWYNGCWRCLPTGRLTPSRLPFSNGSMVYEYGGERGTSSDSWKTAKFTLLPKVGIIVVGGQGSTTSVEFWTPVLPDSTCSLPTLPRSMSSQPTVSWIWGAVLACGGGSCLRLESSGWVEGPGLREIRNYHTSATTSRGLLLIGGSTSPGTTELLVEGLSSVADFSPGQNWRYHCSIQIDSSTIVLTGGSDTPYSQVREYTGLSGTSVTSTALPSLLTAA